MLCSPLLISFHPSQPTFHSVSRRRSSWRMFFALINCFVINDAAVFFLLLFFAIMFSRTTLSSARWMLYQCVRNEAQFFISFPRLHQETGTSNPAPMTTQWQPKRTQRNTEEKNPQSHLSTLRALELSSYGRGNDNKLAGGRIIRRRAKNKKELSDFVSLWS